MAGEIKAGDTVKVRSGGPLMTVSSVEDDDGTETAFCHWFENKRPERGTFPVVVLVKVDPGAGIGGLYVTRG